MSLKIQCTKCQQTFWIDGYSTPDSWDEPGELVISDKADFSECCEHIQAEDCYDVIEVDNSDPYDDVGWERDTDIDESGN